MLLGRLGCELPDVDAVDSSPTCRLMESVMEHCPQVASPVPSQFPKDPPKTPLEENYPHRARVPVRVADQGLDWLKDCLAGSRS